MRVLFVGSNPSTKNLKPEQPFIGARSHDTLMSWIKVLGVSEYTLTNASDKVDPNLKEEDINYDRLEDLIVKNDIIIALGRIAEKAVKATGRNHYIYLPHPSPRNRALNDKRAVARLLATTRTLLLASANPVKVRGDQ